MVSSSIQPSEYIKIKYKLQRTRYILLIFLALHPDDKSKSDEFSR